MTEKFATPLDLAAYLTGRLGTAQAGRRKGLTEAIKLVQKRARKLVGTEHDGWEQLTDKTIEDKERLGYTGQVSETDPLLRTAEMARSIETQVGESSAFCGSNSMVMLTQEMGGGPSHVPPRPVITTAAIRSGEDCVEIMARRYLEALTGQKIARPGKAARTEE